MEGANVKAIHIVNKSWQACARSSKAFLASAAELLVFRLSVRRSHPSGMQHSEL